MGLQILRSLVEKAIRVYQMDYMILTQKRKRRPIETVTAVNGGNIVIGAEENDSDPMYETDIEKTDAKKNNKRQDGFPVVKMLVITVCLLAVCVCGFFLFIEYKKEQERKRRRAAIMERHRARRREEER